MKNQSLKLILASLLLSSQLSSLGNFYGDEEDGVRVYPFHCGPVQGEVTKTSARLWGRADLEKDVRLKTCPLVMGVAQFREAGAQNWMTKHFYVRESEWHAGATDLQLSPGKVYEYRLGYTFASDKKLLKNRPLIWPNVQESSNKVVKSAYPHYRVTSDGLPVYGEIRTQAEDAASVCLFGSCHFFSPKAPLQSVADFFGVKKGGLWAREADETFRTMVRRTQELQKTYPGTSLQIVRMGDQVYVDYGNQAMRANTLDEVFVLYNNAWTREENQALLANHGQKMIADDHEGEDNMDQGVAEQSAIYKWAAAGYRVYQGMLAPSYNPRHGTFPQRWFTTIIGEVPTFVLDLRTKRRKGDVVCDPLQFNSLITFLQNNTGGCFVVSSMPLAPDYKVTDKDKWDGFPAQRNALLDTIATSNTSVAFLQGDVHWHGLGEIDVTPNESGKEEKNSKEEVGSTKIILATASPFFWPFASFEDPNDKKTGVVRKGVLTKTDVATYTLANVSKPVQDNGFGQAVVDPEGTLRLSIFIEDDSDHPTGEILKELKERVYPGWYKAKK